MEWLFFEKLEVNSSFTIQTEASEEGQQIVGSYRTIVVEVTWAIITSSLNITRTIVCVGEWIVVQCHVVGAAHYERSKA